MIPLPWPSVFECNGHAGTDTCRQCDGSHRHQWAASQRSVRCTVCGGRKCDRPTCINRRHHLDPHMSLDGQVVPIGH